MRGFKCLMFYLGFLCIEGHARSNQSYSYDAWVDERITIETPSANDTKGYVTLGDDGHGLAEFCPSRGGYFCVFSPLYAFAVPKKIDPTVKNWTVNGSKFELVRTA